MNHNINNTICLNCHKTTQQNVILKCDHQLCLNCAQNIKTLQGNNPLDIKYKLVCPYCQINTITLNVTNLISQQQDKLVFVNMEDSQLSQRQLEKDPFQSNNQKDLRLSKLREMSYSDRIAMIFTDRRTPDLPQKTAKRGSIDSTRQRVSKSRQGYQQNHEILDIQCNVHKQQNVVFYCKEQKTLLCMSCMYKHMKQHKNHCINSIKQSVSIIQEENRGFKKQAKVYIDQIQKQLSLWKVNKTKLQQAYLFLDQMIKKQFKQLQQLLKVKQKEVYQFLQSNFNKKEQQLNMKFEQLNQTKQILTDYYRYSIENYYSQIYFFNNYSEVKISLEQNANFKVKQYRDQDLLCFNRNSTTKDIQALIEKLFVPKIDGRQSGQRSRATSRSNIQRSNKNQQLKQIPQQTIKLVKKKMKQLNKKFDNNTNKDFKKDKKYQFLQNFNIQEITTKKTQKGSSLNQKKSLNNNNNVTVTPIPQLQKYSLKKPTKK